MTARRKILGAILVWLAFWLFSCLFADEILDTLWFFAFFWWGALYLGGFGVTIWVARLVWKEKRKPAFAVLPFLPIVAFFLLHFVSLSWAQFIRFQFKKPRYERALACVSGACSCEKTAGVVCEIEEGPPVRVAFVQPGGILDNYTAIVYDPTGLVKDVSAVRNLFGGDLIWSEPLGSSWYRCGFT